MAEVTDDFGRVGNFKSSDFDSLADALKSAVGKAVDYVSGKAQSAGDDTGKRFDELVKALEELGDDVKDSLKSTKEFVEKVKKATDEISAKRQSKTSDATASAQKEQTKILQEILRNQQKAISEKAAKFTTGATTLSSGTPRKSGLKEMGFRPRGTDKIPAMLSPGEFIVSKKGTMGNEGVLSSINRGYMSGGKVKPAYLSTGMDALLEALKGEKRGVKIRELEGSFSVIVEGNYDKETFERIKNAFGDLGHDASVEFAGEYEKNLRSSLARYLGGITSAFVGSDPFAVIFEGGVKDITEFRREMRNLAFQSEGITGNFREAQAAFAKIGDDIPERTGKGVTAFQKVYMANARKGFKDQKAAMRTLESGLRLSTLIGSETQATASLFGDWHRELGLGAVQMERMANNMQMVARTTGVTGDELIGVMKSSEGILRNLRNQGTLTTTAARNITQAMAEFKKSGFGEEGEKMLGAMSGYSAFQSADEGTRNLLGVSAARGGVQYRDLMFGNIPQDKDKMGQMGEGLKKFLADTVGVDVKNFDMELLTSEQRERMSIVLEGFGSSIGAAEQAMKTFEKSAAGLGGELSKFEKIRISASSTEKERQEAEKKMNDMMLSSSMDMLGSVRQAAEKFSDKNLAGLSLELEATRDTKFSRDFQAGAKDMADMLPYLSDSMKGRFGLSGTAEQMAEQMKSMSAQKQVELRSMTAAEQIDKSMRAAGKDSKDFTSRMQSALAKGDMSMVKSISEEMTAAAQEMQVKDAKNVDPIESLEQTMSELNKTMRGFISPFVGGILDFIGAMGLLGIQFTMMGTSLYGWFGKDLIGAIKNFGPGEKIMSLFGKPGEMAKSFMGVFKSQFKIEKFLGSSSIDAFGTSASRAISSILGKSVTRAFGPAVLLLGGIKGAIEAEKANRTKSEGFVLGALTGGADTGSFLSPMLGIQKDSALDKTLGVAGAAAWGAAAGAAISISLGGLDFGASIIVGAIVGAGMELVKIVTKGTDILADLFAPFQAIGNWLSGIMGDLWRMLKSFATLNPVTIVTELIGGIVGIISKTVYGFFAVIFGLIRMFVIGLPRLILKAFEMLWELPKMFMESIKNTLAGLADNEWVGPIFKTLSVAFNAIYDGFMAIWTPISQIFSGLGTVFSDLGKALFGSAAGGSILSGVLWALKSAVWGLSYVISWLLSPVILLAKALGFVLKVIGNLIGGIVWGFQYLYDILVGHSIVPDLVYGIIKFFAMLPIKIFRFMATIPYLIGTALLKVPEAIGAVFSNIGSYFKSFGTESIFGSVMTQIGILFGFVGSTISNLVGVAKGVLGVLKGIFTLDFGVMWEGLKTIGSSLMAQLSNVGSFVWDALKSSMNFLFKALKKIPTTLIRGLVAVFWEFPRWLMGKLMDGVWAVGNFLIFDLPKIMWNAFKGAMSAVGKYIWDTISWPFRKLWEFMVWMWDSIKQKVYEAWEFIKGIFDVGAWGNWVAGLGAQVYEGLTSSLQGVWDWIKSWIPGLGTVGKAWSKTKEVAGSAWEGAKSAGASAWEGAKSAGASAWEGLKAAGSYLNPFSYFEGYKEGTKKIEKPGLAMLHAGEMVVPKSILEKMSAMGSGAFGSISSFVRGKQGGESGNKGIISAISERISGIGGMFRDCCPKEAVEDAGEVVSNVPKALADALKGVDSNSLLGRINSQFERASSYADRFFKPLTTGFLRARKRGEGFFSSITKGLGAQYMSATKGGLGGVTTQGLEWLNKSIFGDKEGKDTKKGILQKITEGIFGSKEGESTKKGIFGIIKEGLFGSGDDVKKGIFQIFREGVFGKEGDGGGIVGWFKNKLFGQKMKDGEMGPPKPGLLDAAKNTASSLWGQAKKRLEINTEEGLFNGVKNAAKGAFAKAKGMIFGQRMKDGEMGPPKPGLLDAAKSKATGLYGRAKGSIKSAYGNIKGKLFGEEASKSVEAAGQADGSVKGNLGGFKDKLSNIAEGIKSFADSKVLLGALNLIPSSLGLTAMVPGSLGARMISGIDGESLKNSLKGLAEGVSAMGAAKVLVGAMAMVAVGLASLGLIPAIPMFALLGSVAPLVQGGLNALAKGLSAFGTAAANPLVWMGVGLLAAINVAMVPLAYALSLLSPVIEAFGKAIKYAFEGMGSVLKSASEGIGLIFREITMSKALALGVAAAGIGLLGVAMAAFAAGGFVGSWLDYFSGDGLFNKIMALAAMAPNLLVAATSVDKLSDAFKRFAQNKGGGWKEWLTGGDGLIAGFKKLGQIGTPEFNQTADSIQKMADGMERIGSMHYVPVPAVGEATAAGETPSAEVEPVHLRDITGSILRDRAGSGGNRLQSDELSRMEETAYRQVEELEQIKQGIHELVSLMRPRGASVAGQSEELGPGKTKDPRRPMHAARFGKMKYGRISGQANRAFVNNGEV